MIQQSVSECRDATRHFFYFSYVNGPTGISRRVNSVNCSEWFRKGHRHRGKTYCTRCTLGELAGGACPKNEILVFWDLSRQIECWNFLACLHVFFIFSSPLLYILFISSLYSLHLCVTHSNEREHRHTHRHSHIDTSEELLYRLYVVRLGLHDRHRESARHLERRKDCRRPNCTPCSWRFCIVRHDRFVSFTRVVSVWCEMHPPVEPIAKGALTSAPVIVQ